MLQQNRFNSLQLPEAPVLHFFAGTGLTTWQTNQALICRKLYTVLAVLDECAYYRSDGLRARTTDEADLCS